MSENRRMARAAGLVGLLTLLSRFAGLARDAVVGFHFGTGMAADAFFVAFRIPNLLRRFVAEGAMSTAFIPVFTEYWANRSRREALEAASAVATILTLFLVVLTASGMVAAPWITAVFAPGFVAEPGKYELTVGLTRLTFPYILLISLVALCAGILNSLRHFAAPALAPVFLNLAMITAALLSPWFEVPVRALGWGVLVGGTLQLLVQGPPLWRLGVRLRPLWQPGHAAVRKVGRLLLPMVFGAAVYQINLLVGTIFASVLPGGSVSYLWYADRVFEFPLGIFAVALGTAALPSFAAQAARGAREELRDSLGFALRLTSLIVIPASVGLALLAVPIVSVLFQRGAFGTAEVEATAQALIALAVGLWPVSLVRLVVPAFYAVQDTRTPVLTAAVAFLANVLLSLMLMGPFAASGRSLLVDTLAAGVDLIGWIDLRHVGLALATSLAAIVNLVLLLHSLRRHIGPLGLGRLLPHLLRDLVAAATMAPAVWFAATRLDWTAPAGLPLRLAVLLAAVGVGALSFGAMHWLSGGRELSLVVDNLRRRVSRSS